MEARPFNTNERRLITGISLVMGIRMLGISMIIPVFSIFATELPGSTGPLGPTTTGTTGSTGSTGTSGTSGNTGSTGSDGNNTGGSKPGGNNGNESEKPGKSGITDVVPDTSAPLSIDTPDSNFSLGGDATPTVACDGTAGAPKDPALIHI